MNNLPHTLDKLSGVKPDPSSVDAVMEWAFALVECAINVKSLSFPMDTLDDALRWKEVVPSLPHLVDVRITSTEYWQIDYPMFKTWSSGLAHRTLHNATFTGFKWSLSASATWKARLPFTIYNFELVDMHLEPQQMRVCLPRRRAATRSLLVTSYGSALGARHGRGSPDAFQDFFQVAGKYAEHFTFEALHEDPVYDHHADDYGSRHAGPNLTLETFKSFPLATSLTLGHISGMTPTKLATLAQASPRLRELDLDGSIWEDLEMDCAEARLIAALDSFSPRLKTIRLGYFPVDEDDTCGDFPCLEDWADGRSDVALSLRGLQLDPHETGDCDGCDECDSDGDMCRESEDCDGYCGLQHRDL